MESKTTKAYKVVTLSNGTAYSALPLENLDPLTYAIGKVTKPYAGTKIYGFDNVGSAWRFIVKNKLGDKAVIYEGEAEIVSNGSVYRVKRDSKESSFWRFWAQMHAGEFDNFVTSRRDTCPDGTVLMASFKPTAVVK